MADETNAGEKTDRAAGDEGPTRKDYKPTGAGEKTGLFATTKRTFTEFSEDNLTDWAAALTYYGLLAMFPALIAMVGVIGFFGDPTSTTKTITDIVTKISPGSAAQTFAGPIKSVTSSSGTSGILALVGIAAALWSASGYVGAFMRAGSSSSARSRCWSLWS
jgi:membrane protein